MDYIEIACLTHCYYLMKKPKKNETFFEYVREEIGEVGNDGICEDFYLT